MAHLQMIFPSLKPPFKRDFPMAMLNNQMVISNMNLKSKGFQWHVRRLEDRRPLFTLKKHQETVSVLPGRNSRWTFVRTAGSQWISQGLKFWMPERLTIRLSYAYLLVSNRAKHSPKSSGPRKKWDPEIQEFHNMSLSKESKHCYSWVIIVMSPCFTSPNH